MPGRDRLHEPACARARHRDRNPPTSRGASRRARRPPRDRLRYRQGLPLADVAARYPDEWRRNLRQDDPAFLWPGGESYAELRARCRRVMHEIASREPGGRIIVVTHAGVISQVRCATDAGGAVALLMPVS